MKDLKLFDDRSASYSKVIYRINVLGYRYMHPKLSQDLNLLSFLL